jgi:hypothetical protein
MVRRSSGNSSTSGAESAKPSKLKPDVPASQNSRAVPRSFEAEMAEALGAEKGERTTDRLG